MGSGQSKENEQINDLLSIWMFEEQEKIKHYLQSNQFENTQNVNKELIDLINDYFKDKNKLEKLKLINSFIKYKDNNQALFEIFYQKLTLKQFVCLIVESAMPIWLQHQTQVKGSSEKLIDFILTNSIKKEIEKNQLMSWLQEEEDKQQSNKLKEWSDKINSNDISPNEFSKWLNNTPIIQYLFEVLIDYLILGKCPSNHTKSKLLSTYDYFLLQFYLPTKHEHPVIFSSKKDGNSWQIFANRIVEAGSVLIIIKDKDNQLFGGYIDEKLEATQTNWYGNSKNFLFKLSSEYGVWLANSNTNSNFQYLCWGKKSLPNGLGMGGQFNYAGLWLDSDFIHGHSRAGPLCTTYCSPQLSMKEEFIVDEIEVLLVQKNTEIDDYADKKGVLNYSEDMEFMEMAGKKMYSKDLGPDEPLDEDSD